MNTEDDDAITQTPVKNSSPVLTLGFAVAAGMLMGGVFASSGVGPAMLAGFTTAMLVVFIGLWLSAPIQPPDCRAVNEDAPEVAPFVKAPAVAPLISPVQFALLFVVVLVIAAGVWYPTYERAQKDRWATDRHDLMVIGQVMDQTGGQELTWIPDNTLRLDKHLALIQRWKTAEKRAKEASPATRPVLTAFVSAFTSAALRACDDEKDEAGLNEANEQFVKAREALEVKVRALQRASDRP